MVWLLDVQLHMQSVPITTNFMILNPVHGELCLMDRDTCYGTV
jgi:hypothetical protein